VVVTLSDRYRKAVPYILAVYIVTIAAVFIFTNSRLTVEWVGIVLFGAAVLSGRAMLFVRDWGVFVLVLIAWQLVSPLATAFGFPWHLTPLIVSDRALFFGHVPSVWLQAHLYRPGRLQFIDVLAACMYMLHFTAPLVAGFAIWMANRDLFRKFAVTFVVCAVAGFVTYVVYPAVPPWMAGEKLVHIHGMYLSNRGLQNLDALRSFGIRHPWWYVQRHGHVYLPGVQNIFNVIMGNWYNPYNGSIFPFFQALHMHYDPVGAVPSEHAMYPLLFFLFLRRQFGRIAYLALVYVALLVFSILYLGQHYFTDALIGFAYAIAAYTLTMKVWPFVASWSRRHTPVLHPAGAVRPELEEA
jgi:membrane-associated phospholipid phosphatase